MGDAIAGKKAARLHGTRCELRGSRRVESARLAGHEEERARIVRMFHDEVSSTMLAALFAIESAKDELKAQNLPQAETVAKPPSFFRRWLKRSRKFWKTKRDAN
jgi:signal transduction histidine kinase